MSATRTVRRIIQWIALALALVVATPVIAAAGDGTDGSGLTAKHDAALDRFGFDLPEDELDIVKLRCRGSIEDTGPVTGCWWRSDATTVRAWQVWKLPLRVDGAGRTLVAEVGADVRSIRDDDVTAPGAYLYAVLGLDGDGEIVARSRVERVRFRDPGIEPLRLTCDKRTDAFAATDTAPAVAPSIGCTWSPAETAPVATYVLYRSTKGSDRVAIARVGADQTSFIDTAVEAGVRYGYRVVGLDAAGEPVAISRLDGAGCPKPERERDRAERDGAERDGAERDRRRDHATDRRDAAGDDAATDDTEDAVDTLTSDPTTDREAAPAERDHPDRGDVDGDRVRDHADSERDDTDSRPDRDRRDQRERGR